MAVSPTARNDCGALRAAHAGVALSEAEASVVSPFTAATKSVRSTVDLLREGRCALATSFAGYKFLITCEMPRNTTVLRHFYSCYFYVMSWRVFELSALGPLQTARFSRL